MMKEKIKRILNEAGIFEWSVISFSEVQPHLIECKAKSRLPENAKSIIMAAFPYKVKEEPPKNISRYAAVPDYHIVCGKMLETATEKLKNEFKGNVFQYFLDNSPIPEVATAYNSGLGVLGRNGLLIHKKYGSFIFLGEIVTDLEIEEVKTAEKCLDCGQCISSCPHILSKEGCLSAVNQQKNGLTEAQIEQIRESGVCWGCDKCSEVCPMNKNAEITYIKEFLDNYRNEFNPAEEREGRAYNWRGKKVIERNYEIINSK